MAMQSDHEDVTMTDGAAERPAPAATVHPDPVRPSLARTDPALPDPALADPVRLGAGRRPAGRPTREAAIERDARLLAVATRMFEARGFDATTMEAVADAAGVGKPTIYARFSDKAELFKAVFKTRVERFLTPLAVGVQHVLDQSEQQAGPDGNAAGLPIRTVLFKVGMTLLPQSLTPESVAINRIVSAEAIRFADLAELAHREGWQATVSILATLLEFYHRHGEIVVEDAEEAADLYLSLLVGRLQRAATLHGQAMDAAAIERRVRRAVSIFLDGVATRRDGVLPGGPG